MNRFGAFLVLAFVLFAASPIPAYAANIPLLSPDFELVPDPSDHDSTCERGDPLSYGAVLQLIQNLMNASIMVGALIMIIVFIYAGVLFLLSPTNPGNREMGKTILVNAVIGFIIILASWLIVDMIMKALYQPTSSADGDTQFGPWNEILSGGDDWCIKPKPTRSLYNGEDLGVNSDIDPLTAGSGVTSGGGTCVPPTNQNNACSVTNLQKTCFGDRAETASKICMVESRFGTVDVESGSDKLNSGKGPSYSVGLWQINLTAHEVAGLPCPTAFTARCGAKGTLIAGHPGWCTSSIKPGKEGLYNQCVAAAKIHKNNTEVACRLYKETGNSFQPWVYTATKVCKVPLR